jgi:hypothetical protein
MMMGKVGRRLTLMTFRGSLVASHTNMALKPQVFVVKALCWCGSVIMERKTVFSLNLMDSVKIETES